MRKELVAEKSDKFHVLTLLSAAENLIEFRRDESFKTCMYLFCLKSYKREF